MSDHRESYEPVDRFSEHFRQRLKTYPVAPDKDCWDEIEARLQQQQKRGSSSLRLALLVAASLLAVVFVINHLLTKEDRTVEESSAYRKETPSETAFVADPPDAVALNRQTVPDSRPPATGQTAGKQRSDADDEAGANPDLVSESGAKSDALRETGIKSDLVSEAGANPNVVGETGAKSDALRESGIKSDLVSESGANSNVVGETGAELDALRESGIKSDLVGEAGANPNVVGEAGTKSGVLRESGIKSDLVGEANAKSDAEDREKVAGRETSPPTDKQQPEPKAEKTPDEATTSPEPPAQRFENKTAYRMPDKNKRNKRPNRQLSAGFSPVGGMSSLNTRDMLYYGHSPDYAVGDPGIGTPPGTGTDASPKEQIVDVKPSIPFSAGITVRRKWNRTLGIETGVVYTRLSSDLVVDREGSRYDAVLILHYVGVPVNLTVNLWEKNRFGLYASGGGMVEKGIRSVFKQKTILFPVRMMNDQVNRIPGLQWSLQGGLGISYRFYREMSFFLEPGISYYFDGKQPVSKRTEDPLNFNLRLGVRYDF